MRPVVLAVGGLCLVGLVFALSSSGSSGADGAQFMQAPQQASARQLLQPGALQARSRVQPTPEWGPRWHGSSKRGGKYVVTSVMGLDPERLNIFVKSLRRYSPATRLVVFVEENTKHQLLEDNDAEVIPFKMSEDSALVLYRFELYKQYLGELLVRDPEAGVVLTDSRDVLIQSDPWADPFVQQLVDEDSMLFSLEGGLAVGEVPIRAQPQNAHWVDTCFGEEVLRKVGDGAISCAGITIGSVSAVHAYIVQLLQTVYGEASPKCRKYGSDQATHNYMLHYLGPRGRLKFPYHMRRNWDSPVHTAGYGWPIVIDKDGVYRRVNGSVPPIVHQYDRAFEATKVYLAMYPLRSEEYVWQGPDCVKNLLLDSVKQCPPEDGKGGDKGKAEGGKPAAQAAQADKEAAAAEAAMEAEAAAEEAR